MNHVDTRHRPEELAGKVIGAADAGRSVRKRLRTVLRIRKQLAHGVRGHAVAHREIVPRIDDQADGGEILDCVITQIFVEAGIDDVGGRRDEQRMTVGRRAGEKFTRHVAARARTIVDDERLAEHVGELLRDHAAHGVGAPARGEPDDHAHRAGWITLCGAFRRRRRARREGRQQRRRAYTPRTAIEVRHQHAHLLRANVTSHQFATIKPFVLRVHDANLRFAAART